MTPKSMNVRAMPTAKTGRAMRILFFTGSWSMWNTSASIMRQLRKAVSPVEMGRATTPRMARMPPNVPSRVTEMCLTMTAAGTAFGPGPKSAWALS